MAAARPRRPSTIGPTNGPEPPFPLKLSGEVIKGFGRGSKELGIPTANIPIDGLSVAGHTDLASGVYFGYCALSNLPATTTSSNDAAVEEDKPQIYEMVMSIGWNPFYKNTKRSVEVHVLHDFKADFYGAQLKLLMLGFVREELDYVSVEALVEDIRTDIQVTKSSLARDAWRAFEGDQWLRSASD